MVSGGGTIIRVGFIWNIKNQEWIGGINYYHSLIDAVMSLPDRKIEPVIFTGTKSDISFIKDYSNIEIVRTKIFDEPWFLGRRGLNKILSYDPLLEKLIKKHNINIISHSAYIFRDASIPTVGWIPDFQHKYLPTFFSDNQVKSRDISFERICRLCSCIIFSSYNAKQDAEKYYPFYKSKYETLHFVSRPIDLMSVQNISVLKHKYPISEPYFLIPNQFWVHKNHHVIIRALNVLHAKGKRVHVICTGNTKDYRNSGYYNSLIEFAIQSGVSEDFIVLGIIPYQDLICLMIHSISLINPSLFEGWSTTVEEAKSLAIPIILSDIPVHREQNPDTGIYFHPGDQESLARVMWEVYSSHENCELHTKINLAMYDLKKRRLDFGKQYENIILKTVTSKSKGNNKKPHCIYP